jgi:uncharacterized membrane protein YkvA (DUF1232 family)
MSHPSALLLLWSRIRKEGRMVWTLLRNPDAPVISKLVAAAALVYLVSPVDLIGDFIPILGWADDALVVSGLLWLAYRFLPDELYGEIRRRAAAKTG